MSTSQERTSASLNPDQARDLVIELERSGLDTSRIQVDAAPPISAEAIGRTDGRTVKRPGLRVAGGLIVGAAVGLVLGLIVGSMSDTATSAIVLALTIGAAIIGGLVGLYSRLSMSTELTDVDSGVTSTVRIDVSGLDHDDIETIDRLLATA